MSDEPRKVLSGEVIPAGPRNVSLAPEVAHLPRGMLGMSLFARARYASEQQQFEAYTRLVGAKNNLLRALHEQQGLVVAFVEASERASQLDTIRAAARADVRNNLARIEAEGRRIARGEQLADAQAELELERLAFERDRLRKQRADFSAPPTPSTPRSKESMADRFREVGSEIEDVEKAFEEFRASKIREAGGEDGLSDEVRKQLKQFELLRDRYINDALGALI